MLTAGKKVRSFNKSCTGNPFRVTASNAEAQEDRPLHSSPQPMQSKETDMREAPVAIGDPTQVTSNRPGTYGHLDNL